MILYFLFNRNFNINVLSFISFELPNGARQNIVTCVWDRVSYRASGIAVGSRLLLTVLFDTRDLTCAKNHAGSQLSSTHRIKLEIHIFISPSGSKRNNKKKVLKRKQAMTVRICRNGQVKTLDWIGVISEDSSYLNHKFLFYCCKLVRQMVGAETVRLISVAFDTWHVITEAAAVDLQVQIVSQRCNEKATCNCGVGVRSGDTVFFVDRCRKKSFINKHCKGLCAFSS